MSNPFDVFLSHNSLDKPVVEDIADHLKTRGVSVWLDKDELRPGLPWQEGPEEGPAPPRVNARRNAGVPEGLAPDPPRSLRRSSYRHQNPRLRPRDHQVVDHLEPHQLGRFAESPGGHEILPRSASDRSSGGCGRGGSSRPRSPGPPARPAPAPRPPAFSFRERTPSRRAAHPGIEKLGAKDLLRANGVPEPEVACHRGPVLERLPARNLPPRPPNPQLDRGQERRDRSLPEHPGPKLGRRSTDQTSQRPQKPRRLHLRDREEPGQESALGKAANLQRARPEEGS
jgi:hypothetical protein